MQFMSTGKKEDDNICPWSEACECACPLEP